MAAVQGELDALLAAQAGPDGDVMLLALKRSRREATEAKAELEAMQEDQASKEKQMLIVTATFDRYMQQTQDDKAQDDATIAELQVTPTPRARPCLSTAVQGWI